MDKFNSDLIEKEIYNKRREVRYDIRDLTVEAISEKYDESLEKEDTSKVYNCIYVPDYQRDFTWDEGRQSKFIESIILGLPIPFIFVAENKNSAWEIVDGSQRIRTIHSFVNNNFYLKGLETLSILNGFYFKDLTESRRGKILNTALRIIVLDEETTDDIKKDMFERINRGSDLLKPMENRKGSIPGVFTNFVYDYCKNNKELEKLMPLDKWLERRQEREELILRFFAITDRKAYCSGIKDMGIAVFLDAYLKEKNEYLKQLNDIDVLNVLNKYKKNFDDVCDYVNENFPFGFRHVYNPQTKRSVFEAISVGVHLGLIDNKAKRELDKEYVVKQLESDEFRRYTHVANKLHEKNKLGGRIAFIYKLITGADPSWKH